MSAGDGSGPNCLTGLLDVSARVLGSDRWTGSATAAAIVFSCDQLSMPPQQGVGADERFYEGETLKGAGAAVSPFCPTPCSVNRRGVR